MPGRWWLVIEDDQVDVMTIARGLREFGRSIEMEVVTDGSAPIVKLAKAREERGGRAPDLILLDINLPLGNGHEVLEQLAADPEARRVPVVMLTTSDHHADVSAARRAGAAGYFVKPADYGEFVKTLSTIADYWCLARQP